MRRPLLIGVGLVTVITATAGWQLTHRSTPPTQEAEAAVTEGPDGSSTQPAEPITTTMANGPQPVEKDGAIRPTRANAARTAVRFLETDENLFPRATPGEARSISDSITSQAARARLGDRSEQHQRDVLAKGDLEGLVLRIAPISSRVRTYTGQRATVDVYFLRLWSFPAKGALDDYATVQLDLVWENDEWRLDDSAVIDGPYPVGRFSTRPIVASSAARFEATLADFDDKDFTP